MLFRSVGDEVLDDLEVDVGLEQGEPNLAHRSRDRLVVELASLAEAAQGVLKPIGKGVEHAPRV